MTKKAQKEETKPTYRIAKKAIHVYIGGQIYRKKDNKTWAESPEIIKLEKQGFLEICE